MGKKIALLIGVSDYKNANKLPACERDLSLMLDLIRSTDKYDEILPLDNSPRSNRAKSEISSFIRQYENEQIDEIFSTIRDMGCGM